jgi:glyoxylase-like metal-dependent hydrolase (beta-lactamase superfamily II)
MTTAPTNAYEVLAIRYGSRQAVKSEVYLNFHLYGEPDDVIGMDYFLWVVRNSRRTIVVDTGFSASAGRRRGRRAAPSPVAALAGLGIDPAAITQVVATHGHYDHIGNLRAFPAAEIIMARREYEFWAGPLGSRGQFAWAAEPGDISELRRIHAAGRLTLFDASYAPAPGIELLEVGGHTPGQVVAAVATADGGAVLASDAVHYYEELERDRPSAMVADLRQMYRAYDQLRELASQAGTEIVAGHDPAVGTRFPGRGGSVYPRHVVRIAALDRQASQHG